MFRDAERTRVKPKTYALAPTDVPFGAYWLEWLLLIASFGAPIIASLLYHNANLFARSGALTVFFAAAAEFVTLNRANKKHLLNACRAKDQEMLHDFSSATKLVGWLSFLSGLAGTIIWAYGDELYGV